MLRAIKFLSKGIFFCCFSAQADTLLYFHTSPDDPYLSRTSAKRAQVLKDCGYDVRESSGFGDKGWQQFLDANKDAKAKAVLVEGHGLRYSRTDRPYDNWNESKYFLTKGEEGYGIDEYRARGNGFFLASEPGEVQRKNGRITQLSDAAKFRFSQMDEWDRIRFLNEGIIADGNQLVSKIAARFPNACLWLDTCHAGAVKLDSKISLGTSTAADQKSYNESRLTDDMIELLCSAGPKGNCEAWKAVDTDENGVIDASELYPFWKNKYPLVSAVRSGKRKIKTDLTKEELLSVLGDGAKIVSQTKFADASFYFRLGTEKLVFTRSGEIIGSDSTQQVTPKDTGIVFPKNASREEFNAWREKVFKAADQRVDLLPLKFSRLTYVPQTFQYEIEEPLEVQPFSSTDRQALEEKHKNDKRFTTTHSPQLRNFKLQGLRCANPLRQHNPSQTGPHGG